MTGQILHKQLKAVCFLWLRKFFSRNCEIQCLTKVTGLRPTLFPLFLDSSLNRIFSFHDFCERSTTCNKYV